MNYRYLTIVVLTLTVLLLSGCGSRTKEQNIQFAMFNTKLPSTYMLTTATSGADIVYYLNTDKEQALVQFAQSRVDSGVTLQQMATLNLQKLELSLPGYSFVEQGARQIDCHGKQQGEIVSFITDEGDHKLFHSQFYAIINDQGYVWSITSTVDHTRKVLADLVKNTRCN